MQDFSQGSLAVLFACGEIYCFAVIFGFRRVIFALQVRGANKISLKPSGFNITIATAIISLRRSRNITLAFSAGLCYNGDNKKASPFGRGGGVADGEG